MSTPKVQACRATLGSRVVQSDTVLVWHAVLKHAVSYTAVMRAVALHAWRGFKLRSFWKQPSFKCTAFLGEAERRAFRGCPQTDKKGGQEQNHL